MSPSKRLSADLSTPLAAPNGLPPGHELLELLPTATLVLDAEGRGSLANRVARELLGEGAALVVTPESPLGLAVREGRGLRDAEVRFRRADGSNLLANVSTEWLRDAAGKITGALATLRDLTAQRAGEERLRACETELELIREHAPVILSHWDREHRLRFASQAFAARWQMTPDQMIGRSLVEICGADALEKVRPHLERVLRGESVQVDIEVPYAGLGSRFVHVAYAPQTDESGHVRGYLAAVVDRTESRSTYEALRQTNDRLQFAMRAGKIGLWDWDIATNRVSWSDSLYAIHGISRDQFDGSVEGFAQLIHPDDRGPVQRAIQSSLEHDLPYELEFRAVRPGGSTVWLYTNATVMRENGRPARMVGATLDVTARKAAELGLRESESRFRTLASHAPVGIFLTDTTGEYVFVNEVWRNLSGLTPDAARGKGWARALHPEDRERVVAEWQAAAAARRAFAAEYRFQRPDGATFWLEVSAVMSRNASGAATGYIGILVDITERKAAEDAMRDSAKRFRALASYAPVGIFLTNAAGDTIFVNEAWARMAGIPASEAQGHDWTKAIHPDDRPRVLEGWSRARGDRTASNAEYRFLHPDGSVTWVQGNAVQLRDDEGQSAGYIGTIADVTERKAVEDALRLAQEKLQAHANELEYKVQERTTSLRSAVAQMEEFAYSVSHDLRAPLRALGAYSQALLDDYSAQLDETGKHYLTRMQRGSERMERLIADLLTYSRVARDDLVLVPVDLDNLVKELLLQHAELQLAKSDVEIVRPLGRVVAHELSLGQALTQLLLNAAKFVEPDTRPQIRIRTEAKEVAGMPRRRIWIEDEGIGIVPESQGKLFRVFERGLTKRPYDGTGIGLAIVRKATGKMGGQCGLESDGKKGSRFWIELPAAE